MSLQILLALLTFALVASITPGPNNLMVMASGANFGFRRTVPHMLGIGVGFGVMILLVGLGLMQVFDAFPVVHTILLVASVAYLLYLAWKIANAAPPETASSVNADGTGETRKPMTFLQAAAFQWVNPKGWTMALTAIAIYAPDRNAWTVAIVALCFGLVCFPSVSTWILLGQEMRRLLRNPRHLRWFNWTMAALLVASLYPVIYH